MRRAALVFLLVAGTAFAAPPTSGELQWSDWYRSLRVPDAEGYPTAVGCCDLSDCRPVASRVGRHGYEALLTPQTHSQFGILDPTWVEVPQSAILQTTHNPDGTGRAVVCWMPTRGVMCFVRPAEY
tara:strand:+ start:16 stop:393 length:378 start_codon:yes stop_codon:yes gene_type:complete